MRYTIKYNAVVNRCVYNMYVIVVRLWANIMLHWPTQNHPLNSTRDTLNWIGIMLGRNRRRWADIRLPLDQCLVLAEIQSILTIFWKVHEIPSKKMQMFFQKITKINRAKKIIYIPEFVANYDCNVLQSVESVLMAGQMLRCWPTLKSTIPKYFLFLFFKWMTFSILVLKRNMTLHADITHITQNNNS